MKQFLVRASLFMLPVALVMTAVVLSADGTADAFYLRFTTMPQTSLILGNSRAAQGIQPQVINRRLGRKDLFNYSFTRGDSPYGPTYLGSIKKKLDPNTKNGIFIVTIDAWSISSDGKNPNDSLQFEELKLCLAKTKKVNSKPNLQYLLGSYTGSYLKLVLGHNKDMLLHDDGWLEIKTDIDSIPVAEILKAKVADYRQNVLPYYHFSSERLRYLKETIGYLKTKGKVYLVRLPVHPEMMAIDNQLVPQLDSIATQTALECEVPYLNLTLKNTDYQYIDGNHLYKESGKKVSLEIADWILRQ